MKLTPLDIRKHDFSRKLRGYDPDEVRPFLEMLSQQWEELQEEVRHAQDRVREMENKIRHYEKVEVALQEALEAAKSSAHRTQSHAEERARLLVEEAELKAEQILREAEQERFRLRQDVAKLTQRHAEVTARLRHFLMSELEILAQHEEERPFGFMKLIPSREGEPAEGRRASAAAPALTQRPGESASASPAAEDTAEGTTYADLYARASRRAREQEASGAPPPVPHEDEEPAWTLRSLVSDPGDGEPESGISEQDRIRRILEDLD
jgi:cell division initiation protein